MKKSETDPLSELQTTRFKDDDWILPKRYKINGLVGSGAYGSVVSATDLRTGEEVAIKRNRDIFKSLEQDYNAVTPTDTLPKSIVPTNRSCISQLRVLRELKVLLHAKHENIVQLLEVVLPPSFEQFSDVYIVTDLYEADLRDVLESPNKLDIDQVRYMMYQLLGAIQHLHDSDIVHRDLKPENLLVNSDCRLVLCDLGLARGCNFEVNVDKKLEKVTRLSTNYVQTRPYRAPELILNSSYVGKSTDLWAVGCILAELLNHGQILFNGATNQEQICCIIQLMGTPSPQEIHGSQAAHEFIKKLEYIQPNDEWYLEVFPRHAIDPLALDLMNRLLTFDHNKRITAEKALEHEFFASYKNAPMKPPCRKFNFDFEKSLMVKTEEEIVTYGNLVKKECYDTILRFHGLLDKEPVAGEDVPKKKKTFLQKMKKILKK